MPRPYSEDLRWRAIWMKDNPESLKLIQIYPYRLSVLSRTLEALIRQRKLK